MFSDCTTQENNPKEREKKARRLNACHVCWMSENIDWFDVSTTIYHDDRSVIRETIHEAKQMHTVQRRYFVMMTMRSVAAMHLPHTLPD